MINIHAVHELLETDKDHLLFFVYFVCFVV